MAIRLKELPGFYGIARLDPSAPLPAWVDGEGFVSTARTDEEFSIVCQEGRIPIDVKRDTGWVCFKFQGPFAFSETGILLSVIRPLSENGVGIFAVSTFDTDYLLVKKADAATTRELLADAGHEFV